MSNMHLKEVSNKFGTTSTQWELGDNPKVVGDTCLS